MDTAKPVEVLGLTLTGTDAGNYSQNTSAVTTADITAKALVIGVTALGKVYDGSADASEQVSFTDDRIFGDLFEITYSSALFNDSNVGDPKPVEVLGISISGGVAGNYSLANTSAQTTASISVRAVTVTLTEQLYYIEEKDPEPAFNFTYTGWAEGEVGNEGYTVLRNTDGAPYSSSSNNSAGTYTVTPTTGNSNYSFTIETGVLYVNPGGPGTRAVKPVLNCIEEIEPGIFIANFEYRNDNDVAVHIPVGPDNLLTGSGINWGASEEQPTTFEPGGGPFFVLFDGNELSCTVNSRNNNQKVSNAASANSSSTKCNTNLKSAAVSVSVEAEPELSFENLRVYPNPVAEKVHIAFNGIENFSSIMLYDMAGNVYPIENIDRRSNLLEIDMTQLSSGAYFIRIVMEDDSKVVTVIKQ